MTIIQTERLTLRELTLHDSGFILELLNTPGWIANIGDFGIKTVEAAESYLLTGPINSYEKNGFGLWAVTEKTNGQLIGMCGLLNRDTLDDIDVGYALLPEYTDAGYGYEATLAAVKYAFEVCNVPRIAAICIEANIRSINLLKKLGFTFQKYIRLRVDGDELMYFIVDKNTILTA
ncbi:MAG: N-acetyltransferase [Sphingobacteriaceae bacterium]|nr:MAG: N-acetyltransferase [Sphingobacteriaceae bacterium]